MLLLPTVSSRKSPFLLFLDDIRELDLEFFISKVWISLLDFLEGLGLCRLDLIDVAFLYVLVVERTLPMGVVKVFIAGNALRAYVTAVSHINVRGAIKDFCRGGGG